MPNSTGLGITSHMLIYAATAVAVYLVLFTTGRILKSRVGIPLGWFYHVFCMATALFTPSLLPHPKTESWAWEHHVAAAIVITGAFVSIAFVRRYLLAFATHHENADVPKFVSQIASITVVLVAVGFVLQGIYGEQIPGLLAGAGIAGLVLGLALQDTLSNIFSGFAIYFGGQFKTGDWLQIGERHAEITEFNWRSTRLRTPDNVYLDIPNSAITKDTVVNYSFPTPLHAMRLEVGLEYDAPPTRVKEVLIQAAVTASSVLSDPAPVVYVKNFADSAVTYEIKFWLNDHSRMNEAYSSIRTNLWYSLRRHDISIPYPVHVEMLHETKRQTGNRNAVIHNALSKAFFYECLEDSDATRLKEQSRIVQFGRGEHLMDQGQEDDSMFIVIAGNADILVDSGATRHTVATVGPGDCLGEMSLLTGEKRSATVIATTDLEALEIDKETLAPIITGNLALLTHLSELLAQRRMQNEGIFAEAMNSALMSAKKKDYSDTFFAKLQSFFLL